MRLFKLWHKPQEFGISDKEKHMDKLLGDKFDELYSKSDYNIVDTEWLENTETEEYYAWNGRVALKGGTKYEHFSLGIHKVDNTKFNHIVLEIATITKFYFLNHEDRSYTEFDTVLDLISRCKDELKYHISNLFYEDKVAVSNLNWIKENEENLTLLDLDYCIDFLYKSVSKEVPQGYKYVTQT